MMTQSVLKEVLFVLTLKKNCVHNSMLDWKQFAIFWQTFSTMYHYQMGQVGTTC